MKELTINRNRFNPYFDGIVIVSLAFIKAKDDEIMFQSLF